jgi:hypothetical protein
VILNKKENVAVYCNLPIYIPMNGFPVPCDSFIHQSKRGKPTYFHVITREY